MQPSYCYIYKYFKCKFKQHNFWASFSKLQLFNWFNPLCHHAVTPTFRKEIALTPLKNNIGDLSHGTPCHPWFDNIEWIWEYLDTKGEEYEVLVLHETIQKKKI